MSSTVIVNEVVFLIALNKRFVTLSLWIILNNALHDTVVA